MNVAKSSKDRLHFLKELLLSSEPSSQEALVKKLERAGFQVTQSTVSRDLRKLGAIRIVTAEGHAVYRLASDLLTSSVTSMIPVPSGMGEHVQRIRHNSMLVVIHTQPGSASLVARYVDGQFHEEILGTIAGDDTVFIAPAKVPCSSQFVRRLSKALIKTDK